jgi:hypothetical protein
LTDVANSARLSIYGLAHHLLLVFPNSDWFIPFFRVNKLRVLGDEEHLDDQTDVEASDAEPAETEEPTETEEYFDVDLDGEEAPAIEGRRSWMELLCDNLARHESSSDEDVGDLPSLAGYSSSSSSGQRSGQRVEI